MTHLIQTYEKSVKKVIWRMETSVGAVLYQVHRFSRGIFWNQKMTKRRLAEQAAWPHSCRTRIWGVLPHATTSEERSECWQNPCLLRERSRETPFCLWEFRRKLVRSPRNFVTQRTCECGCRIAREGQSSSRGLSSLPPSGAVRPWRVLPGCVSH